VSTGRVNRLLELLNLLRSGEPFDADDLASRLDVSRRTIFRDLGLLQRAGVPVRYDQRRRGYIIEEWYFLPAVNLSAREALGLHLAACKIANPENFPLYRDAVKALGKVVQTLPEGLRRLCERMAEVIQVRWPAISDARALGEVFYKLLESAVWRKKVQISYDSYYEGREITTVIHPYLLAFVGRAWYTFAYSELHRQVRTFRLERVLSVKPLAESFVRPDGFSLASHLGNAWSLIPEGKVWHVRLRFLPKVAGNVEEVTWHPTQRTQRLPDGSLQFEVDVDGLTEISWWVMGYGDQVIVEEPEELRRRVCSMAEGILRHYRKGSQERPG